MKLFSIHYVDGLRFLDKNHKKFCKLNDIEYNKIVLQENLPTKYTFIVEQLQRNYGETLIFIDSYSLFNSFKSRIDFSKKKVWLQQDSKYSYDNFLVIKSDNETLKLFSNLSYEINKQLFGKREKNNLRVKLPEAFCSPYDYFENNQFLNLRIRGLESLKQTEDCLVISTESVFDEDRSHYFADALCAARYYKYSNLSDTPGFEIINPNKKKALVTLYTKEIEEY
jgi:hypothetical protein